MRKFKLINNIGEEFNLQRTDAMLINPDGLGLSRETQLVKTGDFLIETDSQTALEPITGTMAFKNYELYSEFIDFISKKPLKFGYCPINDWYYADCIIDKLTKSEISPDTNRLYCDIDISRKTPFYKPSTEIFQNQIYDNIKRYPYSYNYTYQSTTSGTVLIETNADDSPLKIIMNGPIINPSWSLLKGDEVISCGKMKGIEIESGQRLVIDSNILSLGIYITNTSNDVIENVYNRSDFSTERFIYAPKGKSILSFSHEGLADIKASVEVREYHDTI